MIILKNYKRYFQWKQLYPIPPQSKSTSDKNNPLPHPSTSPWPSTSSPPKYLSLDPVQLSQNLILKKIQNPKSPKNMRSLWILSPQQHPITSSITKNPIKKTNPTLTILINKNLNLPRIIKHPPLPIIPTNQLNRQLTLILHLSSQINLP